MVQAIGRQRPLSSELNIFEAVLLMYFEHVGQGWSGMNKVGEFVTDDGHEFECFSEQVHEEVIHLRSEVHA